MNALFSRSSLLVLAVVAILFCACKKPTPDKAGGDSILVFDNLWKTMDRNYAMFSYKKTDWRRIYAQYRPQVFSGMGDEALFSVCASMLDSLKDGHVSLTTKNNRYAYNGYYLSQTANFNFDLLKNRYLVNAGSLGILTYCKFDHAGYLYIPSFDNRLKKEYIDNVLSILSPLDALIIDVRNNGGGESALADYLAVKFMKEKQLLKFDIYRKGPGHDDFFAPVPKYLSGTGSVFSEKKVVVLTNRRCFSSCNDFVLYLSLLPNTIIIGDQTGGGGGTPFNYELPNGWLLSYSASFALAPDGYNIEAGIIPDLIVSNTLEDESAGRDAILESAFKALHIR